VATYAPYKKEIVGIMGGTKAGTPQHTSLVKEFRKFTFSMPRT
jgi:hypothetical protein